MVHTTKNSVKAKNNLKLINKTPIRNKVGKVKTSLSFNITPKMINDYNYLVSCFLGFNENGNLVPSAENVYIKLIKKHDLMSSVV